MVPRPAITKPAGSRHGAPACCFVVIYKPKAPDRLEGPSALALANRKLYVLNLHGDNVSEIDL